MWFNFFQQAECVNRSNDRFTCSKTLQFLEFCRDLAGINVRFVTFGIEHLGTFTDIAVKGQDVDHRQGVTFTDFIVVKVVRRVIFTQPVPFSMSACSSPTIGIRRLTSGRMTYLPIKSL